MRPGCTHHATRKAVLPGGAPALALRTTADGLAGTRGSACSGSLRCERTLVFTLAAECGVVASGVGRRRASPGLAGEKCSETYAVLPRAAGKRLHGRVASDRTPVALRASREWRRNTAAHGRVSVAKQHNCARAVQRDSGCCADVPAPRYSAHALPQPVMVPASASTRSLEPQNANANPNTPLCKRALTLLRPLSSRPAQHCLDRPSAHENPPHQRASKRKPAS